MIMTTKRISQEETSQVNKEINDVLCFEKSLHPQTSEPRTEVTTGTRDDLLFDALYAQHLSECKDNKC